MASLAKVGPHPWAPGEHFEGDPLPPSCTVRLEPHVKGAGAAPAGLVRTASETVERVEGAAGGASGPRGGDRNANASNLNELPLPATAWLTLLGLGAALAIRRRQA